MADWQTVRYDPTYSEPLDQEIIPLCDALNNAGFTTISSCCGHGYQWPMVEFEHSIDNRINNMIRYVLSRIGNYDYQPYQALFERMTRIDGYTWTLHIHINDVYSDTPDDQTLALAVVYMNEVAQFITDWYNTLDFNKTHTLNLRADTDDIVPCPQSNQDLLPKARRMREQLSPNISAA